MDARNSNLPDDRPARGDMINRSRLSVFHRPSDQPNRLAQPYQFTSPSSDGPLSVQPPPSTTHHQIQYQPQGHAGPEPTRSGFSLPVTRYQPQLAPHPSFMRNDLSVTTYPPNVTPITNHTTTSFSALSPSAGYSDLVEALSQPSTIRRPQFVQSSQALSPASYPASPRSVVPPVDPILVRIRYTTDTFHAAATNDPAFYLLYQGFRDAQSMAVLYPDLVFFLRLHLQIGWLEYLEQWGRANEVEGDISTLIRQRRDDIMWLILSSQTLKQRAGEYLRRKLTAFAPLSFNPNEVSPVAFLIDHLYELEKERFFNPVVPRAPTRQEYQLSVVIHINYEGGDHQVIKDVNIWKRIGWEETKRVLSGLTRGIQAAQFNYNNGWQAGGYDGKWMYFVIETGAPEGFTFDLDSEYHLSELKDRLERSQEILIFHSQQEAVRENLSLADALGLGLDRPFQTCKPLPPGYRSGIMGEYPNKMQFSLLGGGSAGADSAPARVVRRGQRSEHGRLVRRVREKKTQKAFVLRSKKP